MFNPGLYYKTRLPGRRSKCPSPEKAGFIYYYLHYELPETKYSSPREINSAERLVKKGRGDTSIAPTHGGIVLFSI